MRSLADKIVGLEELFQIGQAAKGAGKVLVSTSGCFDLIHAGHVKYLEQAKAKGDILVVLLNADASVRNLKGDGRPIVGEQERAAVAAGLEPVDYVCIFDADTPCNILEKLQPEIVVKGGDYAGKQIPEMEVVRVYGGKVEYVCMEAGCSTTHIVEKIQKKGR